MMRVSSLLSFASSSAGLCSAKTAAGYDVVIAGPRTTGMTAVMSAVFHRDNPRDRVTQAGAFGIPYWALLPLGMHNLLVAGRMISVDTPAHNSTRNTVCCLLCGQAAGTAAALAAQAKRAPREIDVQQLLDTLREEGALLAPRPNPLAQQG